MTPYDEVPYPQYAHPQTHPDRLATAARLYGLDARPVDACRVLELGCGTGSNVIPMAHGLPGSRFVGVDLAASRIAEGVAHAQALGLGNLELVAGDLAALPGDLGTFDYIIAHGVYSWVPETVRDRLLAVCRTHLADEGVAFVSYNAYPGGHLNMMLREMLLFHVRNLTEPQERVTQALALLQLLSAASAQKDGFHQWIKAEAERAFGHERGHIYHDHLATINEPVYFKDFVAHAARHELQFLAEADFFELADFNFPPATRDALRQLEGNRILREQYMDFLKCRRFRQTLLCRREVPLPPLPVATQVEGMFAEAIEPYKLAGFDLQPGVAATVATSNGGRLQTDLAPGKAALAVLGEAWPDRVFFPDLAAKVAARLEAASITYEDSADARRQLGGFLLELFRGGIVTLHTWRPRFSASVSERPAASPLARWQAAGAQLVTSVFHTGVQIEDDSGRHLMSLLDGTRDRAALSAEMFAFLRGRGALQEQAFDEAELRRRVDDELANNLRKLARFGLLIA